MNAQSIPNPPSNLAVAVISPTSLRLSWTDNSTNETGFKIERAPDNGGSPGTWTQIGTVGSGVTTYVDGGRTLNTVYWYRVRAYNGTGDSAYSNLASAMPSSGQSIRVMHWNVEGNLGRASSNSSSSAQAIARIINYNQPDILLFNELDAYVLSPADNQDALVDWVTNNVPYLGTQTFYIAISPQNDGSQRNGAISRFPIAGETTYGDGLRGLHAFTVQLSSAALQVFHAHLKCCTDDCSRRQYEAQFDADTIHAWAATNSLPYIFGGDWNEDENNPDCTLTSTYHPITTIRQGAGLVEFNPTTLDGEYRTWSAYYWTTPSKRYDYMYAATNRLAPSSGFVFDSRVWANHGLYGGYYDNYYASDHYCVFVDYFFPEPHFSVTPTNTFASSGPPGGPFSPANQVYTLSNTNSVALHWVVGHGANWLDLSATNGILAAGASTNITASINSAATALSVGAYPDTLSFTDALTGASIRRPVNLTVQWPPPVASFTANPTVGPAPLTVTFTDTSTGNITNRFWGFGDGDTTTTTSKSVVHIYAGGSYTVTQIETGPGGVTTNIQPNYVTALTPFQLWQIQYFGSTNNPAAAPTADVDGTGQNNLFKFQAGLDPTNPASVFHVTALAREGTGLRVTWSCVGGRTYALQGSIRTAAAVYTNEFFDISPTITAVGTGESTTNFLVTGALAGPGSAPSLGQVTLPGGGAEPSSSTQLTVVATVWATRGLADAYGNPVALSNLVMFGSFSIDEPTIKSNFQAGNIGAILAAFTPCGAPFAVGDGTGVPGTWVVPMDGSSFIGQQMYIVAVDRPTVAEATQLGIFTAPSWVLPDDESEDWIDLESATDFVVGTLGGPVTVDWDGPYTFSDSAQLANISMATRFYRVRVVP